MREYLKFYIDGQWVAPTANRAIDVIDPATETVASRVALGTSADVDRAVAAARRAFPTWSLVSVNDRVAVLESVLAEFRRRYLEVAEAMMSEMGAPAQLAHGAQSGAAHLEATISALNTHRFTELRATPDAVREAIGVCAFITPWNWPIDQIACRVAPALATGCTMVLKPSEIAPFSAIVWAEIMHGAAIPPGVFNLINGEGPVVGDALARHPDIDMLSFTGSTRAGTEVARAAAPTVKRVSLSHCSKSSQVPYYPSPDQINATCTPDTTWPTSRHPPY